MKSLKYYYETDFNFDKKLTLSALPLLAVISGVIGFIYEIIFYYFNGGMQYVYWRGSSFGPWITIYAIGVFLLYLFTFKFKKHPLAVFVIGGFGCGAFELASGALLFYCFNGHRGWDYNVERWNFGNIGGFVCLRSILVFGLLSLLLMYIVIPFVKMLAVKLNRKTFMTLSLSLGFVYVCDVIYNIVLTSVFPSLMSANEFYQQLGFHLTNY